MNELFRAWTQGMAAHQAAQAGLANALFPKSAEAPSEPPVAEAGTPLEAQFNELRDTWKVSIEKWAALAKDTADTSALSPTSLHDLFDPARWNAASPDAALRRVLDGPRYATQWNLDRKMLELQQLASQRDQAIAKYHAIVKKAWQEALERFSSSAIAQGATAPATWRELTDRWLAVANDTLVETYRTDAFIQAQRQLLRLASEHRLKQQEIAETWCQACHVPTRTEVDETQRQVVELRRQLRALQRERKSPVQSPVSTRQRKRAPSKRATSARRVAETPSPDA